MYFMENCSILINSCDKYSDVWPSFFRILEKAWPESVNYRIYLNTETLSYSDPVYNVEVLNCVDVESTQCWGRRLKSALSRIDSDYILFLLEDFFFEDRIDNTEVLKCLEYIKSDNNIVTISFTSPGECEDPSYSNEHLSAEFPDYILRPQITDYKLTAGPAIWRKQLLDKWTMDDDTPWGWEFFGSKRTWFSKDKFYGRTPLAKEIFKYDIIHGGAVHRGKWVGYKMQELMQKYNIVIDMSQRPVESDYLKEQAVIVPIYKRLPSILSNRYKTVSSIIYGVFHR